MIWIPQELPPKQGLLILNLISGLRAGKLVLLPWFPDTEKLRPLKCSTCRRLLPAAIPGLAFQDTQLVRPSSSAALSRELGVDARRDRNSKFSRDEGWTETLACDPESGLSSTLT